MAPAASLILYYAQSDLMLHVILYPCEVDSALFRTFLMGVLGDFDVGVLDESPWPAFAKSIFVLLMSAGALERNMERGDATLPQASSQLLTFHFHLRF